MALFKVNSFATIGVSVPEISMNRLSLTGKFKSIPKGMTFNAFNEGFQKEEIPKVDLISSAGKWGFYLKKFKLLKNFDFDLFGWLKPASDIYIISICWDYSGNKPYIYPIDSVKAEELITPMKKDKDLIFMGDGINLWPVNTVVGGLNVIIMIFESDQDVRNIGESLANVKTTVNNSKLLEIISGIAANPTKLIIDTITGAVRELIGIVGDILKCDKNDAVDVFQGTYGTEKDRVTITESYSHENSEIEVELTVK